MTLYPWLQEDYHRLRAVAPPHGLLLSGPEGLGKGQLARYWAMSLLCEQSPLSPCQNCPSCLWFNAGHHPDYRELIPDPPESAKSSQASTSITIDKVRALADFLMVSSHRQGWKIIVIEPADGLNLAAANALLKSLEEPPPQTLFILITSRLARIPATLRSRCRLHSVALPALTQVGTWLQTQGIDHTEGDWRRAGGAPLRVREQFQVETKGRQAFFGIFVDPALSWLQKAEKFTAMEDTIPWMDWLHYAVIDMIQCRLSGEVYYHGDEQERLSQLAQSLTLPVLLAWEQALREAQRVKSHTLNARLLTEFLLLPLSPKDL